MPEPVATASAAIDPEELKIQKLKGYAKGCGCVVTSAILAVAVALAAGGDAGAWGAGVAGVLFLVLVVATSGTNGFWGLKG